MWRPPPKPARKHHCARCNQLFSPKRHDAVYCSTGCRSAIYRMRLADDAKADARPIFTVNFRAEKDIDGPRALKALLKAATQKYHLRATAVREEPAKDATQ
jgi:hypothetical protein